MTVTMTQPIYKGKDFEEMFTMNREDLPIEFQVVNLMYEVGLKDVITFVRGFYYEQHNTYSVFIDCGSTQIFINNDRVEMFDLDAYNARVEYELKTARQAVRDIKLQLIKNNNWARPCMKDLFTKQQKTLQMMGV